MSGKFQNLVAKFFKGLTQNSTPIYGPKSVIFGAYAQTWAQNLSNFDKNFINVFRRLAATSIAPEAWFLACDLAKLSQKFTK